MNESSAPKYNENWLTELESVLATPAEAIAHIRPGQRIFIGTGCAQPQALVQALLDRAAEYEDTEIIHLLTEDTPSYDHKELVKLFRVNSFYLQGDMQESEQSDLSDYTPIFVSDIPRLFRSGRLPLDVALIQVTPPNEHGMCSLGVSVDIVKSAAENSSLVIAQVNPQMPWTSGDSLLYIHDIDILVPVDTPVLEAEFPEPTDTSRTIAEYIAALIEDGSTLELGFDRISLSVLEFLKEKRDLGIHTEVISDKFIDLIESGVITGKRKSVDHGKIVASSCMGTRRLFDYIDKNPRFSFHPTDYVSDPHLISQQYQMTSINVALEVDLSGQICTNSLESKYFLGLGNHMDFVRGAIRSVGGKTIFALDSTRSNGTISRIVANLCRGSQVAATCYDVHYVVTEYGVAYLHGKSLQERALAIISIAHPDFRAQLLEEAIKGNYISSDLAFAEGKVLVGPQRIKTTFLLDNGTQILFRPMHPTDEKPMRDLFHSLSEESLYYRFMTKITRVPQRQIQNFVYIDYRSEMAIVGTLPEAHGEEIIAIGRYYLDPRTNRAEVAFTVRDQWQNQGIGTFMLKYLVTIAKSNGIAGFTAEVLPNNLSMLTVFNHSGCKVQSRMAEGVYQFELEFV